MTAPPTRAATPPAPMDAATFDEAEAVIARGQRSFLQVGRALLAIRDAGQAEQRRRGYPSFDVYLQYRWHWSRDYGSKLIRAVEVAESLAVSQGLQITERQAWALATLPVPVRGDVARQVDFASTPLRDLRKIVRAAKAHADETDDAARAARSSTAPPSARGPRPPSPTRVSLDPEHVWPQPRRWLESRIRNAAAIVDVLEGADRFNYLAHPGQRHPPPELIEAPELRQAVDELSSTIDRALADAATTIRQAIAAAEHVAATAPDAWLLPDIAEAEQRAALAENSRLKNEGGYCGQEGCWGNPSASGYCPDHTAA